MARNTAPAGKPAGKGAAATAAAGAVPASLGRDTAAGAKAEPCLMWCWDGKQPEYELTVRCSKQNNISEVKRAQLTVMLPGMNDCFQAKQSQMQILKCLPE
jgi:hypothetical protein